MKQKLYYFKALIFGAVGIWLLSAGILFEIFIGMLL